MKFRLLLFACLLMAPPVLNAQKTDSVRQVIRAMGYDMPRLSPLPMDAKGTAAEVMSLDGTWAFNADPGNDEHFRPIEVPGERADEDRWVA